MVSILVLTYNEEKNIASCLESVQWSDDVHVLDSCSIDGTLEIARKYGVRIRQRKFDNYAAQRNFGLNEIDYKNPWVLMVDADEVVTLEMSNEITKITSVESNDVYIYSFRRKDYFMGNWIKHSSGYPTWFGRLVRIGHVWVEREINEEYKTDGEVGYLNSHIVHYPFNKGFSAWLDKHNRYSTMEAQFLVNGGFKKTSFVEFFNSDPVKRRKAIKSFVYKLPGRPFLMFVALYIFRGGFLDGKTGFTYCILRVFYEFMINCKVKELKRRINNLPL